jgi:hypothetical protein
MEIKRNFAVNKNENTTHQTFCDKSGAPTGMVVQPATLAQEAEARGVGNGSQPGLYKKTLPQNNKNKKPCN